MHATAGRSTLDLNRDAFAAACQARGLTSDRKIAEALGIDRSQVSRVRAGRNRPGEKFVAGVLAAWPEVKFEHFFTVTE